MPKQSVFAGLLDAMTKKVTQREKLLAEREAKCRASGGWR